MLHSCRSQSCITCSNLNMVSASSAGAPDYQLHQEAQLFPSQMQLRRAFTTFQSPHGTLDEFGLRCAATAVLGRQLTAVGSVHWYDRLAGPHCLLLFCSLQSERARADTAARAEGMEHGLTLQAWIDFISPVVMRSDKHHILRSMFRRMDKKCSGRISRDDWMEAVRVGMPRISAAKASDAFEMLLVSGQADLDCSEFVSCMLESVHNRHPHG